MKRWRKGLEKSKNGKDGMSRVRRVFQLGVISFRLWISGIWVIDILFFWARHRSGRCGWQLVVQVPISIELGCMRTVKGRERLGDCVDSQVWRLSCWCICFFFLGRVKGHLAVLREVGGRNRVSRIPWSPNSEGCRGAISCWGVSRWPA